MDGAFAVLGTVGLVLTFISLVFLSLSSLYTPDKQVFAWDNPVAKFLTFGLGCLIVVAIKALLDIL